MLLEGQRCLTLLQYGSFALLYTQPRIPTNPLGRRVASSWRAHQGTFCTGVNWGRFTLEQLQEIVTCVGGVGLSVVLRLMAEDHAGSSGGLPDLLLWRCQPEPAARLVEVKGPTDRLSEQQRAWITAMAAAGLDVFVAKVVEPV